MLGTFSNAAMLRNSDGEIDVDFLFRTPGELNKAKVVARVIMAPSSAKRLLIALRDNLAHYEKAFGEIKVDDRPVSFPPTPPDLLT